MSETQTPTTSDRSGTAQQATMAAADPVDPVDNAPAKKAPPVMKGALIVVALIVVSLSWYLTADRFTPYTDQARLQGYVVGVAPQVSGIVREVWISNNQYVEEGQQLFQIDPQQYEIALQKAVSDLESARRQIESGNSAVDAARANLVAAEANLVKAEKDTARLERLRDTDPGTISMRRLEISRATQDQSRAAVTAAQAQIQQAIEAKGGDDDGNNAILKSAQSAVEKAQLDLDRTLVNASSKGLITDLKADIGQFAGAGSPVMTLISMNDLWVNAEFTENNLGHLERGDEVEILFDALPGQVFSGSVRSIGFGVSSGQPPAQPGTLPTIQNNRDWLRQAQRFPVIISFDADQQNLLRNQLRIGGQTSVIAYTEGHGFLRFLGEMYIRLMSYFSYAY